MKHSFTLYRVGMRTLLSTLLLTVLCLTLPFAAQAENLIADFGFEGNSILFTNGVTPTDQSWFVKDTNGGVDYVVWSVDSVGLNDTLCAKALPGPYANGTSNVISLRQWNIPATANKYSALQLLYKAVGPGWSTGNDIYTTNVQVFIIEYTGPNCTGTGSWPNVLNITARTDATNNWQVARVPFTTQSTTQSIAIKMQACFSCDNIANPQDAFYVDELSLQTETTQITTSKGWEIYLDRGWVTDGTAGICGNGSAFGNPTAPEGVQCGLLQGTSTISQKVVFPASGSYTLTFYAAQPATTGTQSFDVKIDNAVVGTFTPPVDNTYRTYTTNSFTVAEGTHQIQFVGKDAGGKPAFLDAIYSTPSTVTIGGAGWETPVVGSGQFQYDPNIGYRYGPSIIINSDNSIDMWTASPGDPGEWDVIKYRRSTDSGHTWTAEQIVCRPTWGGTDQYSCCDPGVIKFNGYYYLGYTGVADPGGTPNHVFVARSTSPSGPFDKWNGSGWGGSPQPLLSYTGSSTDWGLGEPCFVLNDGRLYIYYTSSESAGLYTNLAICEDPTNANWPANIELYGHVMDREGEDHSDIKFVDSLNRFVGVTAKNRLSSSSTISVLQSYDGIYWERGIVRGVIERYIHNAGISGTETGHLDTSMNNFISYAYQPPSEVWGVWPLFMNPITMSTVGLGSASSASSLTLLNDDWWFNPQRVTDGDLSTIWCSNAYTSSANGDWACLDLRTENVVRGLRVTPAANCFPTGFNIFYSNDYANWYSAAGYTSYADPNGKPQLFQFSSPVTARYFMFLGSTLTGDGTGSYYLKLADLETLVDPVTDTTAPTGTVSINSGATNTNSRNVTLALTASDTGGSQLWKMRFSNDNSTWSSWEACASSKDWTLSTGDGTKTVYVQYVDNACNTCASVTDTIVLDATAPVAGTSTPPASVTTATISVPYTGASDAGTGLNKVELWYKKEAAGTWTNSGLTLATASGTFVFTPSSGSGRYYFDLVAQDNVGNRSAAATGTGDGVTIFKLWWSDGFESNNFTTGAWTNSGCTIQTTYKYAGTYAAMFNSSDILTKSYSTAGKTGIKVEYARYTRAMETDDHFICDWSINGTTWYTLEDQTGNVAWAVKQYSLPVGAENQSGFRVRFRTTHNGSTDYAYLDDVKIIGL